jgi:hypothetical protein
VRMVAQVFHRVAVVLVACGAMPRALFCVVRAALIECSLSSVEQLSCCGRASWHRLQSLHKLAGGLPASLMVPLRVSTVACALICVR